jgi:hypothetical protein
VFCGRYITNVSAKFVAIVRLHGIVTEKITLPVLLDCKSEVMKNHKSSFTNITIRILFITSLSCEAYQSQRSSYFTTDGHSASLFGIGPPYLTQDKVLFSLPLKLCLDSWGFVIIRCPLWRENWSVIYSCYWASSAQRFSGPSSRVSITKFYILKFEAPSIWRARFPCLSPPGTG